MLFESLCRASGRRALVATNNDSAYATALDLARRGIPASAWPTCARAIHPALKAAAESLAIDHLPATRIVRCTRRTRGPKCHAAG